MNKTFYLTEKENEWIKRQGPGAIRALIRHFMEKYPDKMPRKEKS